MQHQCMLYKTNSYYVLRAYCTEEHHEFVFHIQTE